MPRSGCSAIPSTFRVARPADYPRTCGHVIPTSARRLGLPGGTTTQLPNEVLKLVICDIGVPPCRDIRPALAGRLLESLELGFLDALALLDEAQSFSNTTIAR